MTVTFARVAPGLWALTASLPPEMGGYRAVYVPTEPAGLPGALTFTQTWQQPGTYGFLPALPASPADFVTALAWFRRAHPTLGALWLPNPDDQPAAWQAQWLSWTVRDGTGTIDTLGRITLRNLGLWIDAGSTVAPAPDQDALVITPLATGGVRFTAQAGGVTLPLTSPLTLPFTDQTVGTLRGELALDNTGATHAPDLDRLDVGLRYFQPAGVTIVGGEPTWQTVSVRFPLLAAPLPALTVTLSLDPLFPILPSRTLLGLAAGTTVTSSLLSTTGRPLTLTAGDDPANPCGFVPAPRALSIPSRTTDPYYLTPVGAYAIGEQTGEQQLMCGGSGVEYLTVSALPGSTMYLISGQPAYASTMTGPSATSGLPPETPADPLSSRAELLAQAMTPPWLSRRTCWDSRSLAALSTCGTPLPPPPPPVPDGPATLTGDATTSWAYLVGPATSAAIYHAQSDAATLYQPVRTGSARSAAPVDPADPAGSAGSAAGLLDYLELAGTTLPTDFNPAADPPTLFPLVGLAALGKDAAAGQHLEQLAICPARKATITAIAAAASTLPAGSRPLLAPADVPAATTPQGLYATFTDGAMSLLLGQSGAHQLVLGDLQPSLAQAFQSSQLFLVASDRDALSRLAALAPDAGVLTISLNEADTWTFDVLADGWADRGTALIMKFAGRSLLELLSDAGTWSLGTTLNGGTASSLAVEQQSLISFCCQAISRATAGDEDFVAFADIVTDPSWNGILVLNCEVPLDGLPEQMSGVAVGIDPAKFVAHHLGITVTPVQASGGVLTPQDSSLFGLVAYSDPADLVGTDADYRFKVNSLTVRFAASSVVSFASRIELLVNRLFSDPVELTGSSHGNNLVLDGVYQRQGSSSSYSFATVSDNLFTVAADQGAVLAEVDVARAQFVTVIAADQAERKGVRAESRFVLTGSLRLRQLPFDLFSYGAAADGQPGGQVAFANLAVDLTYDPTDPPKTSVYTFDATRLTYDLTSTAPRPDSLFDAFPLTLTGFVQASKPAVGSGKTGGSGTTAATPGSLGFLPVDVPLSQGSPADGWYGIVADLSLGTAGALAAQAGFTASLLVAWAPGPSLNVAVGLKLPGTGGAHKLVSLESVLKLKIAELSLRRVGTAYVLALHNITLSLLSLSFPPSGQTEILLFADPTGRNRNTLAWYGGYAQDPPKPKPPALTGPPTGAELSETRTP